MAAMEEGTKEEKQKLMDKEEVPEAKKLSKRDGTRVFKKTSPNGKVSHTESLL
jgi:hypothetical protein